jgi:Dolichyl-phosphate-mannose-protein mannosyltransferase
MSAGASEDPIAAAEGALAKELAGLDAERLRRGARAEEEGRAAAAIDRASERRWAWPTLALVLAGALGLRLWGVKTGLPYVYNIDEAGHFVPKAVGMSSGDLNPRYFVNPSALTYVLHAVFAVWFGAGKATVAEYARHPGSVFEVARVTVALLGAGAVWLLYLAGARLFDRRVALLAAALEAVAFLPVFYGHFALNDAATLLPLTLSLWGSALVLRRGRPLDYALAGAGLGLACATKYTAGIAALPLLAAAATRHLASAAGGRPSQRRLGGADGAPRPAARPPWGLLASLALAAAAALVAFVVANPYSLLDFHRFHGDLVHQSSLSSEAQGKLGAPQESGIAYYLWSFTWGLGWVPALAAIAGALAVWRREARLGWVLVPAPLLFLAFMGLEGRYFGRWLLPIFPIVCLLGAFLASSAARALAAWLAGGPSARRLPALARRAAGPALMALAALALLGQGLIYSVHSDVVLARADTRALARAWMVAHVPRGAKVVIEPVVPEAWLGEDTTTAAAGPPAARASAGRSAVRRRWSKYPSLRSLIGPDGRLLTGEGRQVKLEDYELTLSPALVGRYERLGYCWVLTGSTQSGRALADPRKAPLAVAYYKALAASGKVVYRVSPYAPGAEAVRFSFDWSFDYYPLAYERPGPQLTLYRLTGGRCRA